MRRLTTEYIYVNYREELNPNSTWVMQVSSPGFCGTIYRFSCSEKGDERFREFIERDNYNPVLVGKAEGYRVYAVIQCCREDFNEQGKGIENHMQNIASEMADFYVKTGFKDEVQKSKYMD